ncbi:subtilisin-like protease SBT5.3 [Hordeum vulgare subsp. vulgare]|uniref:Subtilisin-like protease n=1 Tax=Hordeum vulgare subsp. vulgare TaxID=112509 RepID=A0A8I6XGM1_HORVV|nr:subtilisin-like protease SBT5.3 [Hordeum vulgare subsp. vulgare]
MRSSGKNRSPRAPPPLLAPVLLLIFGLSLLQRPASAEKKSYVVYLGCHSHGREGAALASNQERAKNSHYQFLGSVLGSEEEAQDAIFYSYTRYINGFAATLEEEDAMQISRHPSVVSVFPNRGHRLHTTRSWEFLGMEKDGRVRPNSVWARARYGEGVIIGNLDTGVWPEAGSFSDDGMGPVPARWRGVCHDQSSSDDAQVRCNRKLIGAQYFNKGYAATVGQTGAGASPAGTRDSDGHGTHTLSTAAGRFVPGANLFGYGNGTAKGGAPGARVAAYKVCWRPVNGSECFDADIIAAFDAAIHDGVDVLSVSLGGAPADYFRDGVAIGSFHAVRNGVTVVTSAGNSGPGAGTVSNTAPWLVTVGASTMDREFPAFLVVGNKKQIKGQSLSPVPLPANKQYRLISSVEAKAADATASQAELCMEGSLDRKKAEGKIVVCMRGKNARVEKGEEVHRAGGVGLVLANDEATGNEMIADAHVLPATHITYSDGVALLAYMNSTRFASGYITLPNTALETKPAPFMAAFSSQGPNTVTPQILKPDITAPGVSILAAFTGLAGPTGLTFDSRRVLFNSESGTSMSCPHVAGIAGLLKALHPDWSPAAIKSAIMTTARVQDNTRRPMSNSSFQRATPFAYGAGHVQPNRAADPGLVYDMNATDYLHFLCALGYNSTVIDTFMAGDDGPHACPARPRKPEDLNYPSVTAPHLSASGEPHTVTRRVRNVGAAPAAYDVRVNEPRGVSVSVRPSRLEFAAAGEEKEFAVTFRAREGRFLPGEYVFGQMVWSDGAGRHSHRVRSPLVVRVAARRTSKTSVPVA